MSCNIIRTQKHNLEDNHLTLENISIVNIKLKRRIDVNLFVMSVLFTLNDCLLVSHEKFINQIYRKHIQTKKDGTQISYRMVPELFDLNVPYRTESDTDVHTKKHHRKAVNKKINQEISENQEEYELVENSLLKYFN